MKTTFSLVLGLLSIFCFAQNGVVVYDVVQDVSTIESTSMEEISLKEDDEEPIDLNDSYTTFIHFNNNAFGAEREEGCVWYDFDSKTHISLDAGGKVLHYLELYHIVDYRLAESQNRAFLSGILEEGDVEASPFGSTLNEESLFRHNFDSEKAEGAFQEESSGDTLIWSGDGKAMVKCIPGKKGKKGVQVDPDMLYKYLLYNHEIHPVIAKSIAASGRCPEYIEYGYYNFMDLVNTKLTLNRTKDKKVKEMPLIDELMFSNEKHSFKWHTKLNAVQSDVLAGRAKVTTTDQAVGDANRLQDEGENLSALLSLFNYLLSTGNQPAEEIAEIVPLAAEDEDLAAFLKALASPANAEQAERNVAVFTDLITRTDDYGYIMNIFAANHIQPFDSDRALNYFELALVENSTVAGVYLDLGNLFCEKHLYALGWKCYFVANMLAPEHAMAIDIQRKRKNLEEALPDYF